MSFIFIAYAIVYFILGDGVKQFRKSSWRRTKKSSRQVTKDDLENLNNSKDNDKWLLKEEPISETKQVE